MPTAKVREALLNQHEQPAPEGERPLRHLSRKYVNQSVDRIRRMFRWAVGDEKVLATVIHALDAVPGLRHGKGGRETAKITVVPDAFVDAIRPYISPQVWGLIQLQLHTGMRPGEAICLRGRDLNTSGKLWEISPTEDKTAHFGIDRTILDGKHGQEILKPFLRPNLDEYLFSPQESQKEHYEKRRARRKTRVQPSHICRRKEQPQRTPGEHYTVDTYRQAIQPGCEMADRAAMRPVSR